MCKSSDRSMTIGELCLWEKTGGRSGSWRRRDENAGGVLPGSFDL
jgi:cyclic pyranopterin phosphate synthase